MKDFKKFPYNYFPTCLGGGEGKRGKADFPPYELFFLKASLREVVGGWVVRGQNAIFKIAMKQYLGR